MHTLLDLRGSIPNFIQVSDGKLHDAHASDLLTPEASAIYVMDRGYVDFARLHRSHLAGASFVTHAKSNLKAQRNYSAQTDLSQPEDVPPTVRQHPECQIDGLVADHRILANLDAQGIEEDDRIHGFQRA